MVRSSAPIPPAPSLFLMHSAVNRTTMSGRVVAPGRKASREGALAAYPLQMEKEVGSIVPGKLANFTTCAENPVICPAGEIKGIEVWCTVHEGRVLPVDREKKRVSAKINRSKKVRSAFTAGYAELHNRTHTKGGCACATGRLLAELAFSLPHPKGQ